MLWAVGLTAATLTLLDGGSQDFFPIRAEPGTVGDVFLPTGAQNPPSASLTRQSRFDPRCPQAAGHFLWRSLGLELLRRLPFVLGPLASRSA